MCTLYNNIKALCDEKRVTGGRMCVDIGISKSLMTSLKSGRTQSISTENAQKIADYFGVTVDRVLYGENENKSTADNDDGLDAEVVRLFNRLHALEGTDRLFL